MISVEDRVYPGVRLLDEHPRELARRARLARVLAARACVLDLIDLAEQHAPFPLVRRLDRDCVAVVDNVRPAPAVLVSRRPEHANVALALQHAEPSAVRRG